MKTRLGLQAILVMFLIAAVTTAQAQGRGHNHDRHNGNHGHGNAYGHANRDRYDYDDYYDRRDVVVYHHYRPAPVQQRVVHYYCYDRPRYVYYRDYDVYYDCHRQAFISFSGRNWTVSINRPVCMERVDLYNAPRVNVDYYDDDFPAYLEQNRPHGRVYAEW